MLDRQNKKWLYTGLILFAVGVACLILSPYARYCDYANYGQNYECAPYELTLSFLSLLQTHDSLITAIATGFIAYFTLTLKRSTDDLWKSSRDQLKLAREEFIASHPPIFDIRFIALNYGDVWNIEFTVINIGRSTGTVTGSSVNAELMTDSEWPNPHEYPINNVITPRRFCVGATEQFAMPTSDANRAATVMLPTDSKLRLYGYIVYEDNAENPFTKFFFRTYDSASDRFIPTNNPDYESND